MHRFLATMKLCTLIWLTEQRDEISHVWHRLVGCSPTQSQLHKLVRLCHRSCVICRCNVGHRQQQPAPNFFPSFEPSTIGISACAHPASLKESAYVKRVSCMGLDFIYFINGQRSLGSSWTPIGRHIQKPLPD